MAGLVLATHELDHTLAQLACATHQNLRVNSTCVAR
jgi:hypothetical protein